MTYKYDSWLRGISLLILSDVLTRWMTLNGIFIYKIIYTNEYILAQLKRIINSSSLMK